MVVHHLTKNCLKLLPSHFQPSLCAHVQRRAGKLSVGPVLLGFFLFVIVGSCEWSPGNSKPIHARTRRLHLSDADHMPFVTDLVCACPLLLFLREQLCSR